MKQINADDFISREELIYWVDKTFVQETAQVTIGRDLSDEELVKFTKLLEFGLWDAVFDTIKVAIDAVFNEYE